LYTCEARKIYRIRRDRYRCGRCGYEFSDFAGRWINKVKLPPRYWLWLIKLFELETSARKACPATGDLLPHGATRPFTSSAVDHRPLRSGDSLLDGEVEAKETYFKNRVRATARKFQNRISCLRYSRKERLSQSGATSECGC